MPRTKPETTIKILEALKQGHTRRNAARAGNIAFSTFYGWLQEARDNPESPHAAFADQVEAAESEFERNLTAIARAQIEGDSVTRVRTTTKETRRQAQAPDGTPLSDDDGQPLMVVTIVTTTVEEKKANPRLALEWLRRRHPEEWAAPTHSNADNEREQETINEEDEIDDFEPEEFLQMYHDAIEAKRILAERERGNQETRSDTNGHQKPLLHQCRPLGKQVVPDLRSPRRAVRRALRPLPAPIRVPKLVAHRA